jgi:DNA-binding NarL/FixJ family response regulator
MIVRCLEVAETRMSTRRSLPVLAGTAPREIEVLRLVGQGQSNTQITEALIVAETTVETRAARILAELDLRDRS